MVTVRECLKEGGIDRSCPVLFDPAGESFDMSAAEFKQRVFNMLNKSFGIECIKSVSIILAKIPGRSEDDSDDEANPVVNNAFIAGV